MNCLTNGRGLVDPLLNPDSEFSANIIGAGVDDETEILVELRESESNSEKQKMLKKKTEPESASSYRNSWKTAYLCFLKSITRQRKECDMVSLPV